MDDGNVYAAGRSIWRFSPGSATVWSFSDRGDALADAVELGAQSTQGFRPLMYGEVAGDEFAAVALYTPPAQGANVGIYLKHANRWRQLAVFPSLRTWALVDDKNLGPLVYALVVTDGGNDLIRIDEDGGQRNLVPPLDAGWACSDLTGAPDSGNLYVAMTDQESLFTQGLVIDNVDGGPVIEQQFELGVLPMPNPGGCRRDSRSAARGWSIRRSAIVLPRRLTGHRLAVHGAGDARCPELRQALRRRRYRRRAPVPGRDAGRANRRPLDPLACLASGRH